jgi:tetratricopeptide (TPR) repeat protein
MKMRFALLALAGMAATCGAAQGAAEVIGDGPGRLCFLAANGDHIAARDLDICTLALGADLTTRDRAATFINRGVIKLALNQFADAEADFNRGIALQPAMGEGYLNRGAAYIAQKRFAEALGDIDKGLTLGISNRPIGLYDRAIANEALGNFKAAYDDYSQALTLAPGFKRASDQLKRFTVVEKPRGT